MVKRGNYGFEAQHALLSLLALTPLFAEKQIFV